MKKSLYVILSLLLFAGCSPRPGVDGSEFIGEWQISESTPMYGTMNLQGLTITITKEDIFFIVALKKDGKDVLGDMGVVNEVNVKPELKKFLDDSKKYQLGPDKASLIAVQYLGNGIPAIAYQDDNKTIQAGYFFFKKK
jgi:hypothetical protein